MSQENTGDKVKIERIAINMLNENNWNPNEMDKKIFNTLRKNINKFGFIDLPQVRRVGDKYEIINGAHRVRAAREEGLANIPCVVIEADDKTAKLLTENLNRIKGTHDPIKEAKLLNELIEDFGRENILDLTVFDNNWLNELKSLSEEFIPVSIEEQAKLDETKGFKELTKCPECGYEFEA